VFARKMDLTHFHLQGLKSSPHFLISPFHLLLFSSLMMMMMVDGLDFDGSYGICFVSAV
jgi:hypothetical protein